MGFNAKIAIIILVMMVALMMCAGFGQFLDSLQ